MASDSGGDDRFANGHPLYMQTLGEVIRRARMQKRISQERLGELTGVSRSAVNQWESNTTQPDNPERLARIAEALDLDPAVLIRAGRNTVPPRPRDAIETRRPQDGHSGATLVVFKSVPARGSRHGGFVILTEKDGEIQRPETLSYSKKAFAFKVLNASNSPVYRPRDILSVDPETPALSGDDCLFCDGIDQADGTACVVGNLVRETATLWIVTQYGAPRAELELPKADYPHAWPIASRLLRR